MNKVVRELNISLDPAVDHLTQKGVEIEARPTTKISNEVYQLLLDEFETDKSKKDASFEISEEKRKEKEKLRQIQEAKELERQKAAAQQEEVVRAKASISKPKTLGKIDLSTPKKETAAAAAEPTPKATPEAVPEPKAATIAPEAPAPATEEKAPAPAAQEAEAPAAATEEKIKTQYKKLSGPKKTGQTINLDAVNSKEKTVEEARKRKRKRISKDAKPKNTGGNQQPNRHGNKRGPQVAKVEPTEEEVQKQIRETLEKLQGKTNKSKGAKYRKEKRDQHRQKTEEELAQIEAESKIIKVTEFITVGEIATLMEVSTTEIISACMSLGIMVTMNQRLDAETLSIVAEEFGYKVEFVKTELEESLEEEEDLEEQLDPRAPIVTVMGHVDHGKTSLLDYIRKNAEIGENGYFYPTDKTLPLRYTCPKPTAMRARVTDIAIIVAAADDGIMPQTKEAISHAQAANVPIIFAINKIDKPTANPDKIKEELAGMNLLVEDWGGSIQSQDISALKGTGVDALLEKVLLEAELLELKANASRKAKGTVVEAYLDKGRGYVSTILVQNGTLTVGDYLLAGKQSGKVKAMFDERGNNLDAAPPSTPVSVLGLDGAPQAGDSFKVLEDEKEAKQIAAKRTQLLREQNVRTQKHITLDEIGRRIALGEFQELNIILKGDVDGSVEALTDSLQKLSTEEIQVNIIHKGVGAITESDVLLASASDAIIIGFNVRPTGNSRDLAEKEAIDVRSYSIIYDAINDVKDAMEGMLSPELKEEITGTAEIRETYKISKVGTIAGCMVLTGKIFRNSKVRVIREGVVIYTGALASLKRFKDDAKEVAKGYDCGLQIKNFNDIKEGDHLESFQEVAVKKTL